MTKLSFIALLSALTTASAAGQKRPDMTPGKMPLYAFCGTGDHLWVAEREPVDSPATVDALFEWLAKTYGVKRMYWRGAQSYLWDKEYKMGKASVRTYDWIEWKRHVYNDLHANEAAVAAARRNGMEIFMYTGLFEHGVQPDVGVIAPYLFEDRFRIEHPEWCMLDRWGERRCPGPLSFAYPEVRAALVKRYVDFVTRYEFDGINFYTYVENLGIRYLDEFGFNEPVVREFAKRFPNVDLRRDKLTDDQRKHWYRCRGVFVTQFLRELHAVLAAKGKKLSVILDANEPDYAQPWWSKPMPGTGMIHMDWQRWVDEGIVDELWAQLAGTGAQRKLLDRLIKKCRGTLVKLTVRAVDPYDPGWAKYVAAGVTPIAVTTWARNGVERLSLEPTSAATLRSEDWRLRVQTLDDVMHGKLKIDAPAVAEMAEDPHVLVRRKAMHALAALEASDQAHVIEGRLFDPESSVRIAAAAALGKARGPDSVARILAALAKDSHFQFKMACRDALIASHDVGAAVAGTSSDAAAVREVCVRALYKMGHAGAQAAVYPALRRMMLDKAEDYRVRFHATEGLLGLRLKLSQAQRRQLAADWMSMLDGDGETEEAVAVQLIAALALGYIPSYLPPIQRRAALDRLLELFREYGDGCKRVDAAYGWRVVGNSIFRFRAHGREAIDALRTQRADKWLAWIAYQVLYVRQWNNIGKFCLVDEAKAVADHDQYAPPFPGWRKW